MPPKKKAANGYKFAEPLPKGTIVEDIAKKRWRLGPSIGKGGFGEIYSAQEEGSKSSKYPYVIKIEPHSNGPLFVEINFYIRHAKPADIDNFKKLKGLKTFGMPVYYGSGSHEHKGEKYRFLVMDKFSTDLNKLFVDNNKIFPVDTVFKIGLQLVDVLEYIHLREYVHADIKAANVLLGASKETENKQVYLVDFGLATKFAMTNEFKPNPKKAHDGTIEFLSRDAHQGVQTRRGDLEILAYNLIQWLGCKLPWENNLADPKLVQQSKEENMSTVPKILKACFGTKPPPKAINSYLNYLKTLDFNSEPNYDQIRKIFRDGVKEGGGSVDAPLQFSQSKTSLKRPGSRKKQAATLDSEDEEINDKPKKMAKISNGIAKTTPSKRGSRKKPESLQESCPSSEDEISDNSNTTKANLTTRSKKVKSANGITKTKHTRQHPIASDDDMIDHLEEMKAPSKKTKQSRQKNQNQADSCDEMASYTKEVQSKKTKQSKHKNLTNQNQADSGDDMAGYTAEMKAIALSKKTKQSRRKNAAFQDPTDSDDMIGYTEEMKAIARSKRAKMRNRVVATTSKASSTRGLVKPGSKRLKEKPPLTHGDVVAYSDENSSSE